MASQLKLAVLLVFVVAVCLVVIVSVDAQDPNAKCRQSFSLDVEYPAKFYDTLVVYNISSSKNVQSCVEYLETYEGASKDNFTLVYTEAGVKYSRTGTLNLRYQTNKGALIYNDNPDEVLNFYGTIEPNGVYIFYMCNGDEQFTWIAHDIGRDLSKEAEVEAKRLTDNPADYKIIRDGC